MDPGWVTSIWLHFVRKENAVGLIVLPGAETEKQQVHILKLLKSKIIWNFFTKAKKKNPLSKLFSIMCLFFNYTQVFRWPDDMFSGQAFHISAWLLHLYSSSFTAQESGC